MQNILIERRIKEALKDFPFLPVVNNTLKHACGVASRAFARMVSASEPCRGREEYCIVDSKTSSFYTTLSASYFNVSP